MLGKLVFLSDGKQTFIGDIQGLDFFLLLYQPALLQLQWRLPNLVRRAVASVPENLPFAAKPRRHEAERQQATPGNRGL